MNKFVQLVFRPRFFATRIQSITAKSSATAALDYYNDLLIRTETNSNGRYKFKTNEVGQFLNMVKEDEIKDAIESFNNILGHNNQITCVMFDRFMKKCIDFGQTKYVLDVFQFHTSLRYFPHPSIIQYLAEKVDDDGLVQLCKILRERPLLKVSQQFLSQILKDDPKVSYEIYRLALARNIKLQPKDLYRIARQFLSGGKVRKVGFMTQFAQDNSIADDIYTKLSLVFTYVYLTHKQEAIVELAKFNEEGLQILKQEETYVKPMLELLQKQVEGDEKWKPRLDELLQKLS